MFILKKVYFADSIVLLVSFLGIEREVRKTYHLLLTIRIKLPSKTYRLSLGSCSMCFVTMLHVTLLHFVPLLFQSLSFNMQN